MYHERRRRRGHDRQWHYESVVVPGTATIRRCHQPIKPQVEVKSMNHRRAPADAPCRHRGFIGWKMGGGRMACAEGASTVPTGVGMGMGPPPAD